MPTQNFAKASLTAQPDRYLVPVDQVSERYVLLTLQLPEASRQADRLPLNMSLIIDRSGSMSGAKLASVQEAAIHALRLLTPVDRVAVVIYDDEVEVLSPSRALTPEARDELIQRIRHVRTGGMTNLSGGWFTGCDQIANHLSEAYLNHALLLTDGLANVGLTDQEELVLEAKELRRRGISTTTFGVGHDFNQFLLQGIADGGGGHFYFIDQPGQIPGYFQQELGELLNTVAREMTLTIGIPAGAEVDLLNDIPHEQAGGSLRLFLGDAFSGETRSLVLKLRLPPCTTGPEFTLPFQLRYEDVLQHQSVLVEGQVVRFTGADAGANTRQPVNEQVLSQAGRMELERAKLLALRQEYEGDLTGARATLQQTGALLAGTMPLPATKALLDELTEMDEEMKKGMTEQARKLRHYASYQVHRSRRDQQT